MQINPFVRKKKKKKQQLYEFKITSRVKGKKLKGDTFRLIRNNIYLIEGANRRQGEGGKHLVPGRGTPTEFD